MVYAVYVGFISRFYSMIFRIQLPCQQRKVNPVGEYVLYRMRYLLLAKPETIHIVNVRLGYRNVLDPEVARYQK